MEEINQYKENAISEKIYAGFFIRVLASILDYIFFALFGLIIYILLIKFRNDIFNNLSKNIWIIAQLITILFQFIYNIIIPKYYRGTLGKLIVGINIVKTNFQEIGFQEAFMRYVIVLIWIIFNALITIKGILYTEESLYKSVSSFKEWRDYLTSLEEELEPRITVITTTILINVWIFSEYIILLFNKKKRGLQDYMAGTIIVYKKHFKNNNGKNTNGTYQDCNCTPPCSGG